MKTLVMIHKAWCSTLLLMPHQTVSRKLGVSKKQLNALQLMNVFLKWDTWWWSTGNTIDCKLTEGSGQPELFAIPALLESERRSVDSKPPADICPWQTPQASCRRPLRLLSYKGRGLFFNAPRCFPPIKRHRGRKHTEVRLSTLVFAQGSDFCKFSAATVSPLMLPQ